MVQVVNGVFSQALSFDLERNNTFARLAIFFSIRFRASVKRVFQQGELNTSF